MSRDQVMMAMDAMVVRVGAIAPNPYQPRRTFRPAELAELQASIAKNGLLQRLVVRPAGKAAAKGVEFELIAGERRWRSVTALGWAEVPVDVREVDDATMALLAATENIQRAALSAVEEARAYRVLIDQFGYTQAEVAERVLGDASRQPLVSQRLGLLELPDRILELIEDGRLHWTHARDHLRSFLKRGRPDELDTFFYTIADSVRERTEDGDAIARERLVEVIEAAAWACLGDEPDVESAALTPRWPSAVDRLDDLVREGKAEYCAGHPGQTPLSANATAFGEGVRAYVTGAGAEAKPYDQRGDGDARAEGFGWAAMKHGEVSPPPEAPADSEADRGRAATRTEAEDWRPSETEPAVFSVVEQPGGRWAIKGPGGKLIRPPAGTGSHEFIDDDARLLNAAHYSCKRHETGPVVVLGGGRFPYLADALTSRREGEDSVWTPDGALAYADTLNLAYLAGVTGAPLPEAPPAPAGPAASPPGRPATSATPAARPTEAGAPAAPLGSLPLPGSARREVREGAGLIETLVTAFDGRPGTIAVTPIGPNAMVIIAPRIAKAGETPLSITRPAGEISDQELAASIDAHFT